MHPFWVGLLLGIGLGVVLIPLIGYLIWRYKMAKMRRNIKKMLFNNEILKPIDPRDYNTQMWKDKINSEEEKKNISKLTTMFIKEDDSKINEFEDNR